jgi:hypothetical protein
METKDLITIAEFREANQARILLNYLASEGIRGWLSNETIVTNDWLLGNAVGNVRLQVANVDVEEALRLLEDKPPIDADELSEIALNAETEKPSGPLFDFIYPDGYEESLDQSETDLDFDEADETKQDLTHKEILVDRAFRASILFLAFSFLSPILTWMLIDIYSSREVISPRHQRRLFWATLLHIPGMILFLFVLRLTIWRW